MMAGAPPREPMLSLRELTKRFGGLTAVDRVSVDIYPGEVVGLVGDNGAGKSTLIKMVSGVYQPTSGDIRFLGKPVQISGPALARDLGIETIYQDLALADNLDAAANIFLGREVKRRFLGGFVTTLNEAHMHAETEKALSTLDIHIPSLKAEILTLSGGQRQAIAITRAHYWDAKLMIMDEPTNNLGVVEQRKVLDLIRRLRDRGIPVILISHTMHDVFAVSDRIVVLHRGRKVAEKRTAETDQEDVVRYMIGLLDDTSPDGVGGQASLPAG
ncbi:MAG TPA: ATP-binding cassette domain-containing protein [Trueperaceae bacterium]|nr:ATP-binding cassette domain-containing protein [Trueperaceae bacterium]